MNYGERQIGDLVLTQYGSVVMLIGVDETTKDFRLVDIGISLTPKPGYRVVFEYGRHITSIAELLKLGAEEFDFETKAEIPDSELSELDKVKRDNQRLAERLAKLEQASKN